MKNNSARPFVAAITFIAALGGFLFGFDMAVVSGIIGPVKTQFGLSSAAEGWFVSCALLGCIAGVAFSGTLSDRIGRKKVLFIAAALFLLSAVGFAFSPTYPLLILFRIVAGMGVGVASNISPLYISELAPAARRGRLVTFYQLAITIGILAAYGSNLWIQRYAMATSAGGGWWHQLFAAEPWRGMFLVGAVPATLFFLLLLGVPESPRWLARFGKTAAALDILVKINGPTAAQTELAGIMAQTQTVDGGWHELMRPPLLQLLLLAGVLTALSQFSGINAIIFYGPTILRSAGIVTNDALLYQVMLGAANMLFTFVAIWKVDSLGRRPLYLTGSISAAVALLLTGVCFLLNVQGWAMLLAIVLFLLCFAFSLGPLKFVIATEIFPTHIRGTALSVCILIMWAADWLVNLLFPLLRDGLGMAVTCFIFAGCCLLSFLYAKRHLFETKGKTLEELGASHPIIMHH